ncbi:MAG: DUF2335 domain-containing protein [Rhodobacterales bacterium]|nr:DUF2335 domain-containing protein [Rhodobacterales bacterium]
MELLATTVAHQGPLPSPEVFAGYEHVLPGAADRILSMAEADVTTRARIGKAEARSTEAVSVAFASIPPLFIFVAVAGAFKDSTIAIISGLLGGLITSTPAVISAIRNRRSPEGER